jgi:TolB protein
MLFAKQLILLLFFKKLTGKMQIWRMKPDGIEQQQMTFDEYINWFPNVSPDGKYIAFVSNTKL